jgi:6-phosphogluconolactonase/glucosamine-6-phosphate isomerase/deaminase
MKGSRYIDITHSPKPPENRISLSVSGIQIPFTCLLAVGETKKEAFANFFDDTIDMQDCPAKLLKPDIILDRVS